MHAVASAFEQGVISVSTHLSVLRKYRVYKANNLYSNRLLFITLGALKNIFQLSVFAAICLLLYFVGNNWLNTDASNTRQASSEQLPVNSLVQSQSAQSDSLVESTLKLHEAKWVFRQSEEKYTIQFASSPDINLLYEEARSFPQSDNMMVYPFKKNRNKKVIYGFSVGLYDNLKNAREAISKLPENIREAKPWIRSIGELQIQVAKTLET